MPDVCMKGEGTDHDGGMIRSMCGSIGGDICGEGEDLDVYLPGSHHGEQGGEIEGEAGDSMPGEGVFSAQTLKPKPNRVGGGGLKAKVQFWEMKNFVGDEKLTRDTKSGRRRVNSSAADRKQITAVLGPHGQDRS